MITARKRPVTAVFCLLMVFAMLLTTACGGGSGAGGSGGGGKSGETTYGRYIERDVSPPASGTFQTFPLEGGLLVSYDEGYKTRFDSSDGGETWTRSQGPGADNDRYAQAANATVAPDGSLIIFIEGEGLFRVAPDGTELKIPAAEIDDAIADGMGIMISQIKALPMDRLFLSYMVMPAGSFSMRGVGGSRVSGGGPQTTAQAPEEPAGQTPAGPAGPVEPAGQAVGDPEGGGDGSAAPGPDSVTVVSGTSGPGGSGGPAGSGRPVGAVSMSFVSGLYSLDGSLLADFSNLNVASGSADEQTLYVLDNESNQILSYDLSDGRRSDKASLNVPSGDSGALRIGGPGSPMGAVRGGPFGSGGAMAVDSAGSVYLLSGSDLIRIKADGTAETLLSGTSYSIGAPSALLGNILPLADGSILVEATFVEEGSRLYKYVWDENAVNDPLQTLDVWSLEDSTFVRGVIAAFRAANPDTIVNYEVALSGESGATATDAVKNLNTRMLSGAAPDIIILDGCPAESYAEQGLLLDLSGKVDTSGMFGNILAPFEESGKLWYLPGQFKFPALIGQSDKLASVNSLEALKDAVVSGNDLPAVSEQSARFGGIDESERSAFYFSDLRELFDLVWPASASGIVKNGALDTEALEKMLSALKDMSDKYNLVKESDSRSGMVAMFSVVGGGGPMRVPDSAIWYSQERADFGAFMINSLPLLALQSERPGSALTAFPGLAADSFVPLGLAAVSADTKVEDLAVGFIRTMLSLDVQGVTYTAGLPVTGQGMQAQIDAFNERSEENDRAPMDLNLIAVVESLSEPVLPDEVLTDAVWAEAERLCRGEFDVGRAVANIEQSVKNYLAERA